MTDFTFNEKTGELSHGGKVLTLKPIHSEIFGQLFAARFKGFASGSVIADALRISVPGVSWHMSTLRRRLKRIAIRIDGVKGKGYRLVFDDIPKWHPNIPPPVIIESSK